MRWSDFFFAVMIALVAGYWITEGQACESCEKALENNPN